MLIHSLFHAIGCVSREAAAFWLANELADSYWLLAVSRWLCSMFDIALCSSPFASSHHRIISHQLSVSPYALNDFDTTIRLTLTMG